LCALRRFDGHQEKAALIELGLEVDIMPDLTLDEYRGTPSEEIRRILREEALKICGEHQSNTGLVKAPDNLAKSNHFQCQEDGKRFFLKTLLGFLSLPLRCLRSHSSVRP